MFLKILGFLSTCVPQLVEIRYSFLKKLQKTMKQNNIGKFWEPFFVFCSLSLKIEYWFLKSSKYLSTVPYKGVPYKTILRVLARGHRYYLDTLLVRKISKRHFLKGIENSFQDVTQIGRHLFITCLCKFDKKNLAIAQSACQLQPISAKTLEVSSDPIC